MEWLEYWLKEKNLQLYDFTPICGVPRRDRRLESQGIKNYEGKAYIGSKILSLYNVGVIYGLAFLGTYFT